MASRADGALSLNYRERITMSGVRPVPVGHRRSGRPEEPVDSAAERAAPQGVVNALWCHFCLLRSRPETEEKKVRRT